MFEYDLRATVGLALSHLAAARQQLAAVDLAALSRDELLELITALETDTRRRAAVSHAVVAELEARGVAGELGCSSTAVLLCERLRIGQREAAGRVRLAAEVGPRRPLRVHVCRRGSRWLVAAAVADGVISDRHAGVMGIGRYRYGVSSLGQLGAHIGLI